MSPQSTPKKRAAFRRKLLAWFRRAARDLPWRRTRDPYRVLVSEFMLQQTQVSRVLDYYGPFLRRYPSLDALARATPRAVRESWEGLGYYRRAANLHRLAREVVRDHAGVVPSDPAELEQLPGVGPYTAGAVATFAYEKPVPAIDTNAGRVLRRVFGCPTTKDTTAVAHLLQPRRGKTAWSFNQALMEIGALVCTARAPKCPTCPVNSLCNRYLESGNHS
jgi:A/G-specific adenine glycosylase